MKNISVEEVFFPGGMGCVLLSEDETTEHAVKSFAHDPACDGIFLVDSEQRPSGIVTREALLESTDSRLGGHTSITPMETVRYVLAGKARDLVVEDWPSMTVGLDDNLETALSRMITYGMNRIPVLDAGGNVLGNLTLSQVLLKAIEVVGQT